MKKHNLISMSIMALACVIAFTSCHEEVIQPEAKQVEDTDYIRTVDNIAVFSTTADLCGRSYAEWTTEWWKYVMSFDCANNPLNFPEVSTTLPQYGPVVFLVGAKTGFAKRVIEISKGKTLLVPVMAVLKDYPCSLTIEQPETGISVQDFLGAQADYYIDQATNMKVTLDDNPIVINNKNRFVSDLFYFIGNTDLVNCLDKCVTGKPQSAVSDGYWLFLSNLSPGRHLLRVHAEIIQTGIVLDAAYSITVR